MRYFGRRAPRQDCSPYSGLHARASCLVQGPFSGDELLARTVARTQGYTRGRRASFKGHFLPARAKRGRPIRNFLAVRLTVRWVWCRAPTPCMI
jgi:hypothetical protein